MRPEGDPSRGTGEAGAPGVLERLALHRPELRAWALYDWANSAIFTVVILTVFPYFFAEVLAAGLPEDAVRRRYTLATTIAMAIAAGLGPILGAVADYGRMKKRLFTVFLLLGVGATGGMVFLRGGDWLAGAILFGLANIGIASSLVFYDAFLPHVARPEERDRLSTTGYAVGYLGGGLALAIVAAMMVWQGPLGIAGADGLSARLGFLLVAVWWLVFTVPFLRRVPEPPLAIEADERVGENPVRVAFVRLGETIRELSSYRQAFLMLVAFLVYSDGIGTIIRMAVLYAAELAIPRTTTILCFLLVQLVGIPFAVLFGRLADRIGAKRAILVALAGYVVVSVWAYRVHETWEFVVMALLVGTVQGGAQALSRSLFASLVPRHKSGEFFGLFSTLEKFAGILGPLVFFLAPSGRAAVLWVAAFFVVGALVLMGVDVEAGRRAALEQEAQLLRGEGASGT